MLSRYAIWGVCANSMPCLCHCILWSHIWRHRTMVWLLGLWIICCLLVILYMWSIGRPLSKGGGLVCARNGEVVGPNYLTFSEGSVVKLVINFPGGGGGWCVQNHWDFQWGIIDLLYLFLLKLGIIWCTVPRMSLFLLVVIPTESGFECPIPDKSCVCKVDLLLLACWVRGGHPVSAV